jgi:hypothetical protein
MEIERNCESTSDFQWVWLRGKRWRSQFRYKSSKPGTVHKSDFWTARTDQNPTKHCILYRPCQEVFLDTLNTREHVEFIEFQDLHDTGKVPFL